MSFKSVYIFCVFFVSTVFGFALPFEGLYELDIIHYNDFHARFEETSIETSSCHSNDERCIGGLPRLVHMVKHLFKQKPHALLLNAGDSFQGTYWYTLLKWNVTQRFMNMMRHDAHAIGNHEFDDGPLGLAPYLAHLAAPVLAANVDASGERALQGLFQGHVVVTRGGRQIGVIGLVTQDTKKLSSPGNVIFTDPGEATRREAELLTAKGVDIIILLSHCGLEIDKQLARDHGEYIDIIIGGHSHSLLWNGPAPSKETVAGPYPIFIENTRHKQVLIVQASSFTKYLGNLTVHFDFRGDCVGWAGGPIYLDRAVPEDQEIKSLLAPYVALVHSAENIIVGATNTDLPYQDCVYGECLIGNLLADAFRALGESKVQTSLPHLAFIQRGNIKSSLPRGNITKGEIFELLPYKDRMESFELQGKYVLEALERSVKDAWAYDPFKGPWVLQVSGLRVTYNVSLPEGRRITLASVTHGDSRPSPLEAGQYYRVTAPAYLADGGDGFTMFPSHKRDVRVVGRDSESLEAHIRAHSPLLPHKQGRVIILA